MRVGENVPTANICAYMLNIANMRQYASLLRQFPNQNHLRGCIILTGIVIVFSSCRWNWRMLWPSLTSPASMCDNLKIQMCDLKISISEMNIQLGVIEPWLCVPILTAENLNLKSTRQKYVCPTSGRSLSTSLSQLRLWSELLNSSSLSNGFPP